MTDQEKQQMQKQLFDIYSGILFNNQAFAPGRAAKIAYDFHCPEYRELIDKYHIDQIAGEGTEFQRAGRLLHWMSPRLKHKPDYDNHIPCNALDLLEYSLDKPEQGINCVNKAKILGECCLALGIYARRVYIMPCSPYDGDNHVVTEIYDSRSGWVMLDPSMDGWVIDERGKPLSVLEMRKKFALQLPASFAAYGEDKADISALQDIHLEDNAYYCKNLFRIGVDCRNAFGAEARGAAFWLIPAGHSVKECILANIHYRIRCYPPGKEWLETWLAQAQDEPEPEPWDISSMEMKP